MNVSIVIAAYNAERYIKECIDSIKAQTYPYFEVIIINDGSTDGTSGILSDICDERFRIIDSEHDYIASLNKGMTLAKGKYIARMDADDIMMPERIEKQLTYMEKNPDIAVCSSWYEAFGRYSWLVNIGNYLVSNPLIELLRQNIICHPTTMMRKSFLQENEIFYKRYDYAEDYKIWVDIACHGGKFSVIPEVLLKYRSSSYQVSVTHNDKQCETAVTIKNEILYHLLNDEGYKGNENIIDIYKQLETLNLKGLISAQSIREIIRLLYLESINRSNTCNSRITHK